MSSHSSTKTIKIKSKWIRYLPSSSSIFLLVFLLGSVYMNGGVGPTTKRGFFCNDSSIRYPVKKDTVSFYMLMLVAFAMPSVVIKIFQNRIMSIVQYYSYDSIESLRRKQDCCLVVKEGDDEDDQLMSPQSKDNVKKRMDATNDDVGPDFEHQGSIECDSLESEFVSRRRSMLATWGRSKHGELGATVKFELATRRCYKFSKSVSDLKLFLFGLSTTCFMTGIGKISCGRLRPHFIARCNPNIDCTLPLNMYRYVEEFECMAPALRQRDYNYITTSWPSGHASIVFFSMLYLTLYLNITMSTISKLRIRINKSATHKFSPLFIYSIYVLLVGLAIFISLTRVSDYHHHPTDVLSGSVIGAVTALVMSKYVLAPRFLTIENKETKTPRIDQQIVEH